MNNPIVASLLVALIVTGGILSGGYFGFEKIQGMLKPEYTGAQSVIIELKDTAVSEIRAVKSQAIDEIKKLNAEIVANINEASPAGASTMNTAVLQELKQAVETIQSKQETIAEHLAQLNHRPTEAAVAAPPPPMPMPKASKATLTHTVYFPRGRATGPMIDSQVAKHVPELKELAARQQCQTSISGFSDTLGNDNSNLKLSQKRADYVAARLKAAGLSVSNVRGWGERRLKIHTLDGADNENNRRVLIEMRCGIPTA
jgi:outer membrane protein OmpA-like peptidoglycan-associated protein